VQRRQAIFFLVLALVFGLGAVFTAQRWLTAHGSTSSVVETVPIVVARSDVPISAVLNLDQLEVVKWPKKHAPTSAFSSKPSLAGRVTRRPVARGEPLLHTALLPEGSKAGLVAVIHEDKRAISVKVDAVVGVAGFVTPGSYVDVLATLRRIDLKNKLPYTKVILQDVRVLAIDQTLEEVDNDQAKLVSVVTLEVDPDQAERITHISHEGRLQLALRNPADREVVKTRSIGVADLLPPRPPRAKRSPRTTVQVIKGSELSTRHF
jgi:pilus assembly protein CpaB